MKGKTVLVVAHRLSTIQAADIIVVMGREIGNVIEKGMYVFQDEERTTSVNSPLCRRNSRPIDEEAGYVLYPP